MSSLLDGIGVARDSDRRVNQSFDRVMKQYPSLSGLGLSARTGQGGGYAEFYPSDEGRSPNPGIPTIEVRDKGLSGSDAELDATIFGDALHQMPLSNPDFRAAKSEFMASMGPFEHRVLQSMYAQAIGEGDQRSYEDFVDQSGADAFIRDYMFQEHGTIPGGRPFVDGWPNRDGAYMPALEKMRNMVFGQAGLLSK